MRLDAQSSQEESSAYDQDTQGDSGLDAGQNEDETSGGGDENSAGGDQVDGGGGDDGDGDGGDDSADDEDDEDDDTDDDGGDGAGVVYPAPVDTYANPHIRVHQPPLPDPHACNPPVVCDCMTVHSMQSCSVLAGGALLSMCRRRLIMIMPSPGQFYDYFYGQDGELNIAERPGADQGGMNDPVRDSNRLQRKRCYRELAFELHFEFYRRRLPLCVERAIRRVWPSSNGRYMGFRNS